MKQALHIFLKDLHRLWPQITGLMLAIAYFAVLDIRWPAREASVDGFVIEFIVGATAWFLIARAVHEESLPDENQFWLTRPYERGSLLGAKVMTVVCVVGVPLFIADCLILSMQSLDVTGNLGGLILRQLLTATWLILPPFAIASMTRSITEDVMVWLAGVAIAALTYFPGTTTAPNGFRAANEKYALATGLVLIAVAVWLQYSRRRTIASRAIFAIAVLLPALHFPESTALAIEQMANSRETSEISLTPKVQSVAEPSGVYAGDGHCVPVPVTVEGVRTNWRLAVLSQQATFESDGGAAAGGKTWTSPWGRGGGRGGAFDFNRDTATGTILACINSARLSELGAGKPITVHLSLGLAVFAEDAPISVKATLDPFEVKGLGRCQFHQYFQNRDYVLSCAAPVWLPPQGNVAFPSRENWHSSIAGVAEYPWTPWNLLPGMSPVYKWNTLPMDNQIREALATGGQIEFRPETRIAVLRRDIVMKEARFQELQ